VSKGWTIKTVNFVSPVFLQIKLPSTNVGLLESVGLSVGEWEIVGENDIVGEREGFSVGLVGAKDIVGDGDGAA
jgi:hypothetical protein